MLILICDDDQDNLAYDINILCWPGCSSDNRYITNLLDSNYTIVNDLKFLSDNGLHYNWSARANDGEDYGNWTAERRIDIQAFLAISLVNSSVNFGILKNNENANTTNESFSPLLIQNDGNSFLDISINATSLFTSDPSPTTNYQFKINNSTEPGAFDWLQSLVSWTNTPITTIMAIAKLNYSDSTDSAEIDLSVTVPNDESAGDKFSIILFTSSLGE